MDWMHGSSGECALVSKVEAKGMPGKSLAWVVCQRHDGLNS